MASFKAKFPVLQELFAKNHRGGPLGPPSGARDIHEKKTTLHTYQANQRPRKQKKISRKKRKSSMLARYDDLLNTEWKTTMKNHKMKKNTHFIRGQW